MRKLALFTVLLGLAWCPQVWAQHQHPQPQVTIINGANTPELISDDVAYRVVLTMAADVPAQRSGFLRMLGLDSQERANVTQILNDLHTKYAELTKTEGTNRHPGDKFEADTKSLLVETRTRIESVIPAASKIVFQNYVQSRKLFIQTTEGVTQ